MTPQQEVDYILHDCFFAVGQAIGRSKRISPDAAAWWRTRYRERFVQAMIELGNSWVRDRDRVTAVGRLLGQYAAREAGDSTVIDVAIAARASAHVEGGCRMNAEREAGLLPPPRGEGQMAPPAR